MVFVWNNSRKCDVPTTIRAISWPAGDDAAMLGSEGMDHLSIEFDSAGNYAVSTLRDRNTGDFYLDVLRADSLMAVQRTRVASYPDQYTISTDGRFVATMGVPGSGGVSDRIEIVQMGDTTNATCFYEPKGIQSVSCVQIIGNTCLLSLGGLDQTIRIVDFLTGEELAKYSTCGDTPRALAVSPDGSVLASAMTSGLVYLWPIPANNAQRCIGSN